MEVIDEGDDFSRPGLVLVIGVVKKETPKAVLISLFGTDKRYDIRGVWIPKITMISPMTLSNRAKERLIIFRLPRYTAITKGLAHYEIDTEELVREEAQREY